jgi:hypothetical protein
MELPKDAAVLLSFVNTELRDFYPNLDEFCKAAGVERGYIVDTLRKIDYEYDEGLNKFV